MAEYSVGCTCGLVKYTITTPVSWSAVCHCSVCRQLSGAPFSHFVGIPIAASSSAPTFPSAELEKSLQSFETEKSVRYRCARCGSPVGSVWQDGGDSLSIPVPAIKGIYVGNKIVEEFKPAVHVYYGDRVIDIKDGLPKYKANPGGDTIAE
mmetsp:Transcript_13024/g.41093  ORF Transcript_13024/g.41093 Transcript_13024/m.41093 type:complete len:151 (-) Transcript_13024:40-492(-)